MSRAAMAGDIAGSRFERSLWEGGTLEEARCVGFDVAEPRFDCRGETATKFELFHSSCLPTDDTILTIAVMEWLLHGGDPRVSLRTHFRHSPQPELFGKFFRVWAKTDNDAPCGSVGNGAAMRAAPIGHAAENAEQALSLARQNALATHATPDAIAGAEAMALGVFLARTGKPREAIAQEIQTRFGYDLSKSVDAWRLGYTFTSACDQTVPIAFRAFLQTESHEAAIRAAVSVGGDSDTIACMAAGLAGAYWGIPRQVAEDVARKVGTEQLEIMTAFERRFPTALVYSDT